MAKRNHTNEFAVIGLGRFGSSVARELTRRGVTVLGVDRDAELVQRYAEDISETAILDSTDESALREVDILSYKTVVVAIGNNFEANLITTSILKQFGVPNVIAKAQTKRQREILLRLGANKVILPEYEAGLYLAHELLHPGVIDQFDLGPGYTISEMQLPPSWIGKALSDVGLRANFGATALVIKRGDDVNVVPPSGFVLERGDVIVVVGTHKSIEQISALE
jgi:trk system potassium uptake protein TrkA